MAIGIFAAVFYLAHHFARPDAYLLVALYFIILQFVMITALALLFSAFSSPLLSAVFAFALFIIGTFAQDLRGFAALVHGVPGWIAIAAAYVVPNFAALNVISTVAHDQPVAGSLVLYNTLYALLYSAAAVATAMLIFEHRNLK